MTIKLSAVSLVSSLVLMLGGCASEQVKDSSAPPSGSNTTTAPHSAPHSAATAVAPRAGAGRTLQDPGSLLAKRSIYYDFDQYDIKPEYRPVVEAHAAYLRSRDSAMLRIEGNADERGSREYNLALGQRRADSLKRALLLLGIPDQRIETVSWGEEKPRPEGHDENVWSQHRRSDIVYTQE